MNLESLNAAYQQRLSLLHGYIQPSIPQGKQTSRIKKKAPTLPTANAAADSSVSIAELVATSKDEGLEIVQLLKNHMPVVEVAV